MSHNRLLNSLTQLKILTQESPPSPTFPPAQSTNEFAAILLNFLDVTKPLYGNHLMKHDITHHITTTGSPVSAHPRRLPPESSRLLARNSSIFYKKLSSSHPQAVGHHHYTWCPKRIQGIGVLVAIIVHSTMPQCQTDTPSLTFKIFTVTLFGDNIFSKSDLVQAYPQTPVEPTDVHKTAITTHTFWCVLTFTYAFWPA